MKRKLKKLQSIALIFLLATIILIGNTLTVKAASIKLNKTSASIYITQKVTLKLTCTTKKVTWSSSNKNVATVTTSGVVTGRKKGTAVITAMVSNKKYNCKISVKNRRELKGYTIKNGTANVTNLAKAISGMKKVTKSGYKLYYSGNRMEIGMKRSDFGSPYYQLTDIKNLGNTYVSFYGVNIGDSYNTVKTKLKKSGFICAGDWSGSKYTFMQGNAATTKTKFKNNKLTAYTWALRYTG